VYFYDALTLELEEEFVLKDDCVSAEFSPSGRHAVVLDIEGMTRLIDVETGTEISQLRDNWTVLGWSSDSSRLAVGYGDGTIHILDAQNGDIEWDLTVSRFEIEEVAFSPRGGVFVAKDEDGWFAFWDLSTGKELLRDRIMLARDIQISLDEETFVFISGLGTLNVWTFPDEWVRWDIIAEVYGPKVSWFIMHPDGEEILVGYQSGGVNEIRDLRTGEELGGVTVPDVYSGELNRIKKVRYKIRDQTKIELRDFHNTLIASTSIANFGGCMAFLQGQGLFATNTGVWDVWTGKQIYAIDGDCPVQVSRDGLYLVYRRGYRYVYLLDIENQEEMSRFSCPIRDLYVFGSSVYFDISLGGSMLGCYTGGERVAVYEVASGEQVHEFRTIQYSTDIKFSEDGRYLGALSHGFLRVWDLEEGSIIHDPIRVEESVAWWASEDLMTWLLHYKAGTDSVVSWGPWRAEEQSRTWLETEGYFESLFSPDGKMLALAKSEGIEVWSAETGQKLASKSWSRGVPGDARLAFSPDSKWLAMYLSGGPVWLWGVLE
jgi:WD40 repeat protein